jgi:hypothetical protein
VLLVLPGDPMCIGTGSLTPYSSSSSSALALLPPAPVEVNGSEAAFMSSCKTFISCFNESTLS